MIGYDGGKTALATKLIEGPTGLEFLPSPTFRPEPEELIGQEQRLRWREAQTRVRGMTSFRSAGRAHR